MKIWTKVTLSDKNKSAELMSKAFTNYLYMFGPIDDICNKYKISYQDKKKLDQYTANRIAGLLMLYLAGDTNRINDIANKYNFSESFVDNIVPEIEGYINK